MVMKSKSHKRNVYNSLIDKLALEIDCAEVLDIYLIMEARVM